MRSPIWTSQALRRYRKLIIIRLIRHKLRTRGLKQLNQLHLGFPQIKRIINNNTNKRSAHYEVNILMYIVPENDDDPPRNKTARAGRTRDIPHPEWSTFRGKW